MNMILYCLKSDNEGVLFVFYFASWIMSLQIYNPIKLRPSGFRKRSKRHFQLGPIFGHLWVFSQGRHSLKYRTRAKISRAYSKFTRFLDTLIFEHFRKMLIFEPCLFKIYTHFEALFFKIKVIFWPISMYRTRAIISACLKISMAW